MKTILTTLGIIGYFVFLWTIDSGGMTDTKAMQLEQDYKDMMGAQYAQR